MVLGCAFVVSEGSVWMTFTKKRLLFIVNAMIVARPDVVSYNTLLKSYAKRISAAFQPFEGLEIAPKA